MGGGAAEHTPSGGGGTAERMLSGGGTAEHTPSLVGGYR